MSSSPVSHSVGTLSVRSDVGRPRQRRHQPSAQRHLVDAAQRIDLLIEEVCSRLLARHALAARDVDVVRLLGGAAAAALRSQRGHLIRIGEQRRRRARSCRPSRRAPARARAPAAQAHTRARSSRPSIAPRCARRARRDDRPAPRGRPHSRRDRGRRAARSTAQSRDARRSRRCSGRGNAAPAATSSGDCRQARARRRARGRCPRPRNRGGNRAGRDSRVAGCL